MRWLDVAVAWLIAVLFAIGGLGSYQERAQLEAQAEWHLARASASAETYVRTLEAEFAEQQLASFAQRRGLLENATRWELLERACVLFAVLTMLFGYGRLLRHRFLAQQPDGLEEWAAIDAPAPRPPATAARP